MCEDCQKASIGKLALVGEPENDVPYKPVETFRVSAEFFVTEDAAGAYELLKNLIATAPANAKIRRATVESW